MTETVASAPQVTEALVAALFAVDPVALGGVVLTCDAGPARERWLALLAALLPEATSLRKMPLHIDDDRLLGGLDLAATLQAGRPVAQRGLLAAADGGIVLLAMAERLGAAPAASVAAVLDHREVSAERRGMGWRHPSRIGVVALDEGLGEGEQVPACLRERLAFLLTLQPAPGRARQDDGSTSPAGFSAAEARAERGGEVASPESRTPDAFYTRADVAAARERIAGVRLEAGTIESLCAAATALGIDSIRAPMLACRAARVAAALDGRDLTNEDDASLAAALVLAPRATRLPSGAPPASNPDDMSSDASSAGAADAADAGPAPDRAAAGDAGTPHADSPPAETEPRTDSEPDADTDTTAPIDDVVLEAALAAIPAGLLAELALGRQPRRATTAGRVGAAQSGGARGRPVGARRGLPRRGARLDLVETLRAAAPMQAVRRRENEAAGRVAAATRILVRRDDFHVSRLRQRSETTTVFVVDASGSAALNRLAEAKGAVELLLADCYVRRDSVAVIAFRGSQAELLLPPTRSLVRAKRSLAGLPGGGGTPLAAGIAAAHALADSVRRRGASPLVVLLTDGRANIAIDGTPGRARAGAEALAAARKLHADGVAALLLDTSPQPHDLACQLAAAMGARYLPLPHAGAAAVSQAVRAVAALPPARPVLR